MANMNEFDNIKLPEKEEIEEKKSSKKWYKLILNKYVIILILFLVWMIFFDQNSYFIHHDLDKEIRELELSKKYYQEKLEQETIQINRLKSDADALERVAREKHYLKKENEDLFIIEKEPIKSKEK